MADDENSEHPSELAVADTFNELLREIARDGMLPHATTLPGTVFAGRFVVERLAGRGGMGAVYRGTDLQLRTAVAIKVMASPQAQDATRFVREATVLAELSHPAIVGYIAHGTAPQGTPFLAMEWLEGESLSERLARAELSVAESLSILRRACEGLAAAHSRGIVHRDIKPSNLFLVGADPAALKVLDFGIAQANEGTRTLTQAGCVLGTVGYMSPEQATGSRDLDARSDIFALGCVLFECLTGRAAFEGPNALAVLAKVLRDEPPRIGELRSGLSSALEQLVSGMLAKNPAARPASVSAILSALSALQPSSGAYPLAHRADALTATEQKVVSVIFAKPRPASVPSGEGKRARLAVHALARIRELTLKFQAEPVAMRGGALMIVLSGANAATDQAAQAARCAWQLAQSLPESYFVVATGRAETTGKVPVGAAIDRAAQLLAIAADPAPFVALDRLTADLLTPDFVVEQQGEQLRLVALQEANGLDYRAALMGKPTSFVGRDKELQLLEHTLRECSEDSVARAVLVCGPPGIGKSRLARELRAKVAAAGTARLLFARADPIAAGSALSLVQQLVGYAAGLHRGDSGPVQQAQLRGYLAELVASPEQVDGLSEFLGEMLGAPTDRPASPSLRAARNDREIMCEQVRRSFLSWLAAEASARTLFIVLEDLHWSDLASVNHVGEALRSLSSQPVLLLALARPEVHEHFPRLWQGAQLQEMKLGGLTPRAAERFVRTTLGPSLDGPIMQRIVQLADGNAFYLEELMRHVAAGHSDLPETVLTMAQTRLERVAPELRRVLRAASVFGDTCWSGAVAALSGEPSEASLERLADHEILVRSSPSRFPAEPQYVFRHALLRDAAYAMLTQADLAAAHRMAGDWLERSGEKDARAIADHFERGGANERAVPFMERAARMAMDGGDPDGARELAQRGLTLGATGYERALLLTVQATANTWIARFEVEPLLEALSCFPVGDPHWWSAVSMLLVQATGMGQPELAAPYVQMALAAPVTSPFSGPRGMTVWMIVAGLERMGMMELARSFAGAHECAREDPSCDPLFIAWLDLARSTYGFSPPRASGALEQALLAARRALTTMDALGTPFGRCVAAFQLGIACNTVGCDDEAASHLARCLDPRAPAAILEYAKVFLARIEIRRGRTGEAAGWVKSVRESNDSTVAFHGRVMSAQILAAQGQWEQALAEGMSCRDTGIARLERLRAVVVARAHFGLGQLEAAAAALERAVRPAPDSTPEFESSFALLRAEIADASGDASRARTILREARDRILETSAGFQDPRLGRAFEDIDWNRKVLSLAARWFGEESR